LAVLDEQPSAAQQAANDRARQLDEDETGNFMVRHRISARRSKRPDVRALIEKFRP
jgi:hypothetical protein